jgi:PilZ domain
MDEKRQHIRTAFAADIKLIHPAVGELQVNMRDMSDGGVFLFTGDRADLAVGEVVQIQAMDIEDAPVLSARIVRRESSGIGLMFLDV